MGYTKTTWVDGTTPAINATNLNNIEDGMDAQGILTADASIAYDTAALISVTGSLTAEGLITDEGTVVLSASALLTGDPQTAQTATADLTVTASLVAAAVVGREVGPEIDPIIVLAGDSPVVAWKCDPETVQVSKAIPSTFIVWRRADPVVTVTIPDDTLLVSASLTGTVAR